jgi:hypothetical protein
MSLEVSDLVVALAPADDVVVLIDPVELTPVAVTEPLPVDVPEDGLTYVGPIDVHVDPFPIDPLSTDVALTDGTAGEGTPVDDGSIITTAVIDDVPTDMGVTDDVGIIACEDYPVYKSECGDGEGPTYVIYTLDPLPADDIAGEGTPVDDGSIITTAVIDDVPTDLGVTDGGDGIGRPVDPEPNWRTLDGPADGGSASEDTGAGSIGDATAVTDDVGIIACEDYPLYKSECGDGAGPTYVIYTLDPLPADDIAGEGTPVDDGSIITTAVIDDVPSDIGVTDDGEVIGRPVDPEPNWRTLDGPADDGSISEGIDITVIACEDYPVYMCEIGDSAGPTDVIYTLDPADPLIYASATDAVDSPGRSPDPLPYERGATVSATVPESDPEIDRTPVHYAASDSFHTGLDLL